MENMFSSIAQTIWISQHGVGLPGFVWEWWKSFQLLGYVESQQFKAQLKVEVEKALNTHKIIINERSAFPMELLSRFNSFKYIFIRISQLIAHYLALSP